MVEMKGETLRLAKDVKRSTTWEATQDILLINLCRFCVLF